MFELKDCFSGLGLLLATQRNLETRIAFTRAAQKEVERVEGIEPSWPAWKAGTLPLSYTR